VIDEVVSRGIRTAIIVVFMFGFFPLEEPRRKSMRLDMKYARAEPEQMFDEVNSVVPLG
jgi:hypothetical protein